MRPEQQRNHAGEACYLQPGDGVLDFEWRLLEAILERPTELTY